ncbi:MAG: hypothetical protein AAFY73_08960 [Pseudomonadota bacterium]
MPSLTLDQSVRGVKFSALVLIGFGLLTILGTTPTMAGIADWILRLVMFDFSPAISVNTPEERLLCAILGGVISGWGMMVWMMAEGWYRSDPAIAGRTILVASSVWFVIDGTGSVLAGAASNLVPNIGVYLILVLPVLLYNGHRQAASAQNV